ncbi:MAG: response regulator [Deltaproteobacteria bacterium]|nr:response regulator [Deltaproteobacteria bacterium]
MIQDSNNSAIGNRQSAIGESVSILIVDDDFGMLQTLNYILTEKGCEVETAADGFEAVERIKERAFDVVLTDIKMPGLNGVGLLKEVNRLSPETTTVMMTAYTLPELVGEAKRQGAVAVLPKPLDLDKIIAFIDELGARKPILILDDDVEFCKTLQKILNKKGCDTIFATEVDKAINLLLESQCRVVLLDMKLNGITGLDALIAIKKADPRVIVILMTGYREEMAGLIEESLKKTAFTCLDKPFDIEELVELLKMVGRKRLQEVLGQCQ